MRFQSCKMNSVWNGLSLPILLIMFLCEFCSSEVVFLLLGGLSLYYLVKSKGIRTEMSGFYIYVFMLSCGFLMGMLHLKDTGYNFYAYIKHVYYVAFPFLMWYTGENITKKNKLFRGQVYRTIVMATAIFCIWDLANFAGAIVNFSEFSNDSSKIYQFRSQVGYGDYFAVIGLYMLLFFQKELMLSKPIIWTGCLIHGLSVLVHFSRTALLMVLIFGMVTGARMLQIQKEELKLGQLLGACLAACLMTGAVAIICPEITKDFLFKIKNTFIEMSPFHDDWTLYRVSNSWRGYEAYCAFVRFDNADLLEKLFGGGFGATLDVFGFAYLVTTEETLPFLHNGYFTQLMVFGVVGVIAMLAWFVSMWKAALTIRIVEDRVFVLGLVACIVCMTAVVGGPLFSPAVAQLLFLVATVSCIELNENNNE